MSNLPENWKDEPESSFCSFCEVYHKNSLFNEDGMCPEEQEEFIEDALFEIQHENAGDRD